MPMALTEWNSGKDVTSGAASALIVAELISDYVKAGVEMACFWPMRYPGGYSKRSLLEIPSNDPRPAYTAMKLFSSNMAAGSKLVKATLSNKSVLGCASLAADDKHLAVFLINKGPAKEGAETVVAVEGLSPGKARAITLAAADLKSEKVAISEAPLSFKSGAVSLTLPPNSLTVIVCE